MNRRKRDHASPSEEERGRALVQAYRLLLEEAKRTKAAGLTQQSKVKG